MTGEICLIVINGLLLITSIVIAAIYYGQLCQMKSATKATEIAAQAAKVSAQAASDGVKATQTSMRSDQRAWVGVKDIRGLPQVGQSWEVVIIFHNSGKTFAQNISAYAFHEPVKRGGQPTFSYVHDRKLSGGLISPGADYHVRLILTRSKNGTGQPAPLTQPLADDIDSGEHRVYVHGIINYDDVFGVHHWVSFCYFWDTETRGFGAYSDHNDTDHNE
jgi:hypothetical protein